MCVRLKLAGQGVGRSLDRRRDRPVYVTVVSVMHQCSEHQWSRKSSSLVIYRKSWTV